MRKPDRVGTREPALPVRADIDASRLYLRSFIACVLLLVTFNLPALLLTSVRPEQFLSRMKLIFGLMAWVATILAVQRRQRLLGPSLNYWDEAAAFFALGLACSIALRFMA